MTKYLECDVLIVGTGGAGCRAALSARESGAKVIQIAKGPIGRCELTAMTMPGFGVLMPSNPEDSREKYFLDTIDGGCYINDRKLVNILIDGSEGAIQFLEDLGVRFDRHPDGTFIYYSGVEHTKTGTSRQLGIDDRMGRAFYNVLCGQIARSGISLIEDVFAVSLLTDDNRISGLFAINIRTGLPIVIWAGVVVIATGGIVGLFPVRTGHPRDTADGHALALRQGVELKDIEFIQSNPAAFYYPESVRGVIVPGWYLVMDRGAKYFNGRGEEFLHHYDPVRRENTTRDIKARAMQNEILAGRSSEHGGVYLDFTGTKLDTPLEDYLARNAPFLLDYVKRIGLPPELIFERRMEVGPAAHYSCGGIAIDANCETSLDGLLAAGEVTGGVHGANRLGNNSMTDIFVFGRQAGERAAVLACERQQKGPTRELLKKIADLEKMIENILFREPKNPIRVTALRAEVEDIMFKYVGFAREAKGLQAAMDRLAQLKAEKLPRVTPSSQSRNFNSSWVQILELGNLIDVGQAVARAALERTETRGCHNRLDFPEQDDERWLCHVLVRMEGDEFKVNRIPIE